MGVLDDAIKEHLELKRRHGTAEEELQRQEEEALGPARRDVAHQHEEEAEPAAAAQEAGLFDGEDAPAATATADPPDAADPHTHVTELYEPSSKEPSVEEPPGEEPPAAVEPTPLEPPPVEPPPAVEPEAAEPDVEAEPPAQSEETDAEDARLGDTQPHGFDALDEEEPEKDDPLLSDPEGDEQDVLEDTPDFLQETPEHDRLWFEQKPPRDFDFD